MNKITNEWIIKAEGDYHTSLRDYRARKNPNYDSACFHAQQCIEKYFKALLQKENTYFPKTHDLTILLDLLLPHYPFLEVYRNNLKMISVFAVEVRYPGESVTKDETRKIIRLLKQIRNELVSLLSESKSG